MRAVETPLPSVDFYEKQVTAWTADQGDITLFTEVVPKSAEDTSSRVVCYRKGRPALVVSSTSWTADEDFGLLFDALRCYDTRCAANDHTLPNLVVVITGKGPNRDAFETAVHNAKFKHICVSTGFVPSDDYWRWVVSPTLNLLSLCVGLQITRFC